MAQVKRSIRISTLIKRELGQALATEINDPRIGFVTVTDVQLSEDLKHAHVFFSVIGTDADKSKTQHVLNDARVLLQQYLASVLKLRYTPKLSFFLDSSVEEGMKIDNIIRDIHHEAE